MSSDPLLEEDKRCPEQWVRQVSLPYCRVCYSSDFDGDQGPLLSPCMCNGSVSCVHQDCLNAWRLRGARGATRASHCELCNFNYRYEMYRLSRAEAIGDLIRSAFLTKTTLIIGLVVYLSNLAVQHFSIYVSAIAVGSVLGLRAIGDLICASRVLIKGEMLSLDTWSAWSLLCIAMARLHVARLVEEEVETAQAAALAQVEAGVYSQSVVSSLERVGSAESDLAAIAQTPAVAPTVGDELPANTLGDVGGERGPRESGDAPVDDDAPVELCCSRSCCCECLCFLAIPPSAYAVWWCLHELMGTAGLIVSCVALSWFGFAYFSLVGVIQLTAIALRPPLCAYLGDDSLPVVRNLSVQERDAFSHRNLASKVVTLV